MACSTQEAIRENGRPSLPAPFYMCARIPEHLRLSLLLLDEATTEGCSASNAAPGPHALSHPAVRTSEPGRWFFLAFRTQRLAASWLRPEAPPWAMGLPSSGSPREGPPAGRSDGRPAPDSPLPPPVAWSREHGFGSMTFSASGWERVRPNHADGSSDRSWEVDLERSG